MSSTLRIISKNTTQCENREARSTPARSVSRGSCLQPADNRIPSKNSELAPLTRTRIFDQLTWAGLFYLALYFNAQLKLKVIAAHNLAYWKMIMFFAPVLGAFLISASLTTDKHHHWYDLVVGGLIGVSTALVAYRQTFASIFDYRFNHILLPRATSLFHRKPFFHYTGQPPYFSYGTGNLARLIQEDLW